MTFERLVRNEAFASQTVTTTVGAIGLNRPTEVVIADAKVNKDRTADLLTEAHQRASADGAATLIHQLAVPFVGFEDTSATDVKPDFAVVAPNVDRTGSWLVVGDAKDYERHRSRVEDSRLLKGFLQVAVGAESAAVWSKLPAGMRVHQYGALAVPRNAFLQPEALVEDLADHRREVAMRIAERRAEANGTTFDPSAVDLFVEHLIATYDPASCPSCSLFAFCRAELRKSTNPTDLLVEIGIAREVRPHVAGIVDGTGAVGPARPSVVAQVVATKDGLPQQTKQRRVDPIGLPGTVNLVLAKADAAALGVHGIAIQVVTSEGPGKWQQHVFPEPQSPQTRRAVVRAIGAALTKAIKDRRVANPDSPEPVHLVVPDKMTADVLVSIADNLAGLELSRLRWAQDKLMGRPQLTFDGEPAQVPLRLSEDDRTAVAFLLEDDRARAMTLRSPIVNAQEVLNRHHVVGGPAVSALRLDYVVAWFLEGSAVDHRNLADDVENLAHTPGARLTNIQSNAIHATISGPEERRNVAEYDRLVRAELAYKSDVLTKAIEILDGDQPSRLRVVHRTIESDAQTVWQRRLRLHASDLVRFGRTYRWWRNALVEPIQDDQKCRDQLLALANPQTAQDLATDAGQRMVAFADVVSVDPLVLDVHSRRIVAGSSVVLLHVNDDPCVEHPDVGLKVQGTSFQFQGMAIGPLSKDGVDEDAPRGHLLWTPKISPALTAGDRVVVADSDWFAGTPYGKNLNVKRPAVDGNAAPKPDCVTAGYADDPDAHNYCCKPHEVNEAEWSDTLAERRAAGLLNPETWPPVRNDDAFESTAADAPQGDPYADEPVAAPDDATLDDVD
ncbi:hypothetical protein [Nocardioides silvaticus]|nr:hypothetical protein [Nocardioides silvaticus]